MTNVLRPSLINPAAESYGYNMRGTNRLLQRELSSRVARMGLSIGQWYALRTLWENDGVTQIELAEKSGIAGPMMVSAVRGLLAMGLITRHRPQGDKRKYVVSLTPKGWELEDRCVSAAVEVNRLALEGVSPEDIATCLRVLRATRENLLPLIHDADPAAEEADRLNHDLRG